MKNNHLNEMPFFRAMGFIGDVFLLNLAWLLGCVLLVTIGASTSAAFSVAGKMAARQEYRVFHDYWGAFRRDFKLATITWVVLAAAGLLIFADYQIGLAHTGTLSNVMIAAGTALGVVWLCVMGGGYALLGRYTYRRWADVLRDGLRICLGRPAAALVWLVGMAMLPVLNTLLPALFWYLLPLWVLIGGGGIIVATAFALRPAFARLEGKQNNPPAR